MSFHASPITLRPLLGAAMALAFSGSLAACGGGERVTTIETESEQNAVETPTEGQVGGGREGADSDEQQSGNGDSSSIEEGVGALSLDASGPEENETQSGQGGLALDALSDEATASAFCRWQSVIEQQDLGLTDEQCNARALECQALVAGSDSEQAQLPVMMRELSDELLAIEECDLSVATVDGCVAELLVVFEPYAETMACGQEPEEFPSLDSRITELPRCLALVGSCEAALEAVQASLSAEE